MSTMDHTASIAAVQASLNHIEKTLEVDRADRAATSIKVDDIRERVTRLESAAALASDLPQRLSASETDHAVETAVREEREAVLKDIRRAVFGAISAVAALVSIASFVIIYMVGA
jgi:Mg2+ and Co2+ transporter CorA